MLDRTDTRQEADHVIHAYLAPAEGLRWSVDPAAFATAVAGAFPDAVVAEPEPDADGVEVGFDLVRDGVVVQAQLVLSKLVGEYLSVSAPDAGAAADVLVPCRTWLAGAAATVVFTEDAPTPRPVAGDATRADLTHALAVGS
jgi:hypothetical protein